MGWQIMVGGAPHSIAILAGVAPGELELACILKSKEGGDILLNRTVKANRCKIIPNGGRLEPKRDPVKVDVCYFGAPDKTDTTDDRCLVLCE